MDNAGYVGLTRQAGLLRELNTLANNIANVSTTGYRRGSLLFAEHVKALGGDDPSLSMATASRSFIDFTPGEIKTTGNPLDFAIESDAFFMIETPAGQRLTRAGAFTANAVGELVTPDGARVLDEGGGAIVIPPSAREISAAPDGTIFADGQPVGRLGLAKVDPALLVREGDNLFRADKGFDIAENPRVRQFALEGSNVSAVNEIAQLIEVQRTYEMGQQLFQGEDDRIRRTVRELGQSQ